MNGPFYVRFGFFLLSFLVIVLALLGIGVVFDIITTQELWEYAQRIVLTSLIIFVAASVVSFFFGNKQDLQ